MLRYYSLIYYLTTKIVKAVSIILIIAAILSYGEIIIKNTHHNPTYSSWNIFANMIMEVGLK